MMNPIPSGITPALPTQISEAGKSGDASRQQHESLGKEFESVFVSMLLKEMRLSLDEGFFGGEETDSFGGMFDLFVGQHLSQTSPLGIANMLTDQYDRGRSTSETGHQESGNVSLKA